MFHGSLVALVTPMLANGDVDYQSLEKLVAWHLANDTDGLVILGTTGESATIEIEERQKIVQFVVKQVAEKVPVIVGTGANNTRHAIEFTRLAMEDGADAALLVTPYYNKPTQEGLYQHYKTIANTVPIPQILYNVPSRTACDLLPETVQRLAECSNIVALKEATASMERLDALKALNLSIDLLSGDDGSAMEFMLRGGQGVVSVVANVVPREVHALCNAATAHDRTAAEKCNDQIKGLYQPLFAESNPIPTKWALTEMGMIENGIRLPLTPLSQKYHQLVRSALQAAQIGI